ncbi:hypothetical protein EQ500_06260 [Lactobacillus sp. XV13L]|nr:hypothetical protein [Lactobacillus sp. XV13L]
MLVNGEKVNNLILGGETFISKRAFPAYYDFPNMKHTIEYYPTYDISSCDKNTGVKFEQSHIAKIASLDLSANHTLVYAQILSAGDKYLLLKSLDGSVTTGVTGSNVWVRGLPLWFKLSELGGEMIPVNV